MFKKTLLAATLAGFSVNAFSAAFQIAEHSASGLGRAFAGEAAVADDASVVARNPALMSLFTEKQISLVGNYIMPDVELEGTGAPVYADAASLDRGNIAPKAFVPAGYMLAPVNDKVAVGFGLFTNFGLSTDFPADYSAGQLAGKTEITTVNLNLSVSYKVSEQWSLGLGVNAIYADAAVLRHFGVSPLPIPAQTEAVNLEGDDYGYGWNAGVSYEPVQGHRFGFHYRSETDIDFSGEYSNQLPATLGGLGGQVLPGALSLTLPAIAEFSGSHQISAPLRLHYSLQWTGWSSFEKLEAYVEGVEAPVFQKSENFSNSLRLAIGGDYKVNANTAVRAGIAYDEAPADKNHLSISIPDTNRLWLTAGVNRRLDNASSIDVGVAYLQGESRNFTETDNLGQQWQFRSEGDATLISAQYNLSF